MDEEGRFLDANKAALKFLECDRDTLKTQSLWEISSAGLIEDYQPESGQIFAPRNFKVNGKTKTLLLNVVPVSSKGQNRLYGIGQDITHQVKMKQALAENEDRFSTIFEESPLGMIIADKDYRLTRVNAAFAKMLGYTQEELIRMGFPAITHPDNLESDKDHILKLIKGEIQQYRTEKKYIRKDGRTVWGNLIVNAHRGQNGEIRYFLSLVEDITERKEAIEKIKQSEAKFRAFFEQSLDGVVLIDKQGVLIGWNKTAEEITGLKQADTLGKRIWDVFSSLLPDDVRTPNAASFMRDHFFNYIVSKNPTALNRLMEHEIRRADGEIRVIQSLISKIGIEDDFIICNDFRDVTELQRMEAKLLSLYENEKAQRQELEEEARARGMFIQILAHELRTPLTPILVSSDMLHDIAASRGDETQQKLIANLTSGAKILSYRLEELLDLGEYTTGAFKLRPQSTDMGKFLEQVIPRLRASFKRNQNLIVSISPDMPQMEIDRSGIERVMTGLIFVTARFCPDEGEIHFRAGTKNGEFRAEFEVEGMIITQEEKSRLFQPYHRAEQDRQRFPGIGLSLAVSKQIVEAHGGKMWLENETGQKNTFIFTLPIK